MSKQLRIDFPDYPAKQQERDAERAERLEKTDVYVSRVDGVWNALVPREMNYVIHGENGEDLPKFCERLKRPWKKISN